MPRTTKKKKKDAKAPKHPLTAYMVFCNESREKVKQTNPNISFGQVGKELGRLWKALDSSEKEKYEKIATELKASYKKELEKYKETKSSSSSEEKESPKKKRKKRDKDAPKPKLSAYLIFSKETRPKVKEHQPSLSFGEIGKHIGEKWRELSESDKQKFNKLAEDDKERWEKENSAYLSKGGSETKEKTKEKNHKKKASAEKKSSSESSSSDSSSSSGSEN